MRFSSQIDASGNALHIQAARPPASAISYRTTLSTVLTCASTLLSIDAIGSSTRLENLSTRFRDSAVVALDCCLDLTATVLNTSAAVFAWSWLDVTAAWRLW